MKKFTFQKRSKKVLLTRIRGQIMPTRNKPQKIDKRITSSKYKTNGKINDICSVIMYLLEKKINWNKQHFGTR